MSSFTATALRGALRRLETELQVTPVTSSRTAGRTKPVEGTPRIFRGVLSAVGAWKQVLGPGGEYSMTEPILVVSSDLRDSNDTLLSLAKDWIITSRTQRFQITKQIFEDERFGIRIYTLTEHPGGM